MTTVPNTCSNCQHALVVDSELECHRAAPRPQLEAEVKKTDPKPKRVAVVWPLVNADSWCSEWGQGETRL